MSLANEVDSINLFPLKHASKWRLVQEDKDWRAGKGRLDVWLHDILPAYGPLRAPFMSPSPKFKYFVTATLLLGLRYISHEAPLWRTACIICP